MKSLITRALSGLIYVFIIFLCTTNYLSDILYTYFDVSIHTKYIFFGLITLFFIGCLLEIVKLLKYDSLFYKILTIALAAFVYYNISKYFFSGNFVYIFQWKYLCIIILFILAIVTLFRFSEELETDSAKLIFTTAYIVLPFGLSLLLPDNTPTFTLEIFYIFLLLWISDSFAYLIGSKFGKKPLAPKISPNKSIEGFIGGIFGTVLAGCLIEYFNTELKGNWVVIGIIISIFAPLGDLAESKLKRIFGIKDSGNLMPGHGGVLDRLDSFIFCIPFIFAYYVIINII